MASFPQPKYNQGDRVYCHPVAGQVDITDIKLTPQRQLRYIYRAVDSEADGECTEVELGDPPTGLDDVPDLLYINSCSVADIVKTFPSLPGGKGKLAREIVKARNETPFNDERNFIDRMLEIEPKCEWSEISHRLKYDIPKGVGI